jgi:hypothetical protein
MLACLPTTNSEDLWAWKKVPPKPGKPTTMKKIKRDYHWCPKHKLWCIHRPEECKRPESPVANETVTVAEDQESRASSTSVRNDPILQSIVNNGRVFA